LVTGAGGKDDDIASTQLEGAAAIAAQPNLGAAAGDAKGFVNARMIVQISVDSVPPAVAPAVTFKQFLHHGGRIERAWQVDRAPIDDNRPPRVIRNFAVVAEAKHAPLAAPQQRSDLLRTGTLPAGHALGRFLQVFQQSHRAARFYKTLISAPLSTAAAMHLFRQRRGTRTQITSQEAS
jgi:hypothetical protein